MISYFGYTKPVGCQTGLFNDCHLPIFPYGNMSIFFKMADRMKVKIETFLSETISKTFILKKILKFKEASKVCQKKVNLAEYNLAESVILKVVTILFSHFLGILPATNYAHCPLVCFGNCGSFRYCKLRWASLLYVINPFSCAQSVADSPKHHT